MIDMEKNLNLIGKTICMFLVTGGFIWLTVLCIKDLPVFVPPLLFGLLSIIDRMAKNLNLIGKTISLFLVTGGLIWLAVLCFADLPVVGVLYLFALLFMIGLMLVNNLLNIIAPKRSWFVFRAAVEPPRAKGS